MPRWFTHLAAWILVIAVVVVGLPVLGERAPIAGESSAEFRLLSQRMDELERENRRLRGTLDHYRRLDARIDRIEVSRDVPSEGTPLRLFDIPATVTFCDETLPLRDPEVHRRFEEEWYRFLVNRHWVIKWQRRTREVFPVVEAALAARDMPDDLKYVLVIESGVEARATSGAGAVGWWQFMKGTGRDYGLSASRVVDDRRDLERATEAALDYMSDLYEEFGSWPLVLSAYNSGERRVRETIEEQRTYDFYDMVLPTETEAYWFKAAAAKTIMSDPTRYQLVLPDDGWSPSATDTLEIRVMRQRLELGPFAAGTGMSYRDLKQLNPSFRTTWLPNGRHRMVVPRGRVEAAIAALGTEAKLIERRVSEPVVDVDIAAEPTTDDTQPIATVESP